MKHLYTLGALCIFTVLFIGSAEVHKLQTSQTTYVSTQKAPFQTHLSYENPVIVPDTTTPQQQKKGDVTISCSIKDFSVYTVTDPSRKLTYADPGRAGFDVYEVVNTPRYVVNPDAVYFHITIKNNQDRILKLNDVAVVSMIDGIQYDLPEQNLIEWKSGMILKNYTKSYEVKGPSLNRLGNDKVIYISINDVPVQYDAAGNVLKKENFEWFFRCRLETVQKDTTVKYTYDYQPVETRQCSACEGRGSFERVVLCGVCKGYGSYINQYNGKRYNCTNCASTGKVRIRERCTTCGGNGMFSYPKSQSPPIKSNTNWHGWQVQVKTVPTGAIVKVADVTTGEYIGVGYSNKLVDWYTADFKEYPIIVEYQGKQVKVIPYGKNGKPSPAISVDFTGTPKVKKGKQVE